jgi:hypothetical protein
MKKSASARIIRETKTRLERAKQVVIAARERAAEMAQQPPTKPIRITGFQRRRMARLSAKREDRR